MTIGGTLSATDSWAELASTGLINTTNGYGITVALVSKASRKAIAYGKGTVVAKT